MAEDTPVHVSSYIPLRLLKLIEDLKQQYPAEQRHKFSDMTQMLRAVCLVRHDKERMETLATFWRCNDQVPVYGGAADNQIETTFLLNFHSLLKQGNYSLLTQAECECADGDGFLLDVECTLDSSKMDPNFLTGLFDAQPQLAVGTESFGQKMLVYHRGMGMVSKHGRFVAAKMELLKDLLVGAPLRKVLGKKETEKPHVPHITDVRRSLRTRYTTATSLLKELLSMTEVVEPTFEDIVLLYRRAPPKPTPPASKRASRFQKVLSQLEKIDGKTDEKNDWVVLKSYAHVPVSDLELCFPDTTVALPMFDIVMTVVLCLVALLSLLPTLLSGGMTSTMLPLIVMVLGRVVTKVTVLLNLKTTLGFKKSLALYNKSRDSQESVLTHKVQMMIEQELMQVLLAYTLLLTVFEQRGAVDVELDKVCEEHLFSLTGKAVDFNVQHALELCERHHIISKKGKRWVPLELDRALQQLDTEMDNLFNYSEQPAAEAKPKEPKDEDVDELRAMLASKEEEVQRLRKQQTLLCAKVKQLDEAMMEL